MPLIQLEPHLFTSLPRHPDLQGDDNTPDLREFIQAILLEAHPLLNQFPSTLKPDCKLRSSSPSHAKVKLSRGWRTLQPPQEGPAPKKEFWVCRQSDHQDSDRLPGTVSLWEFHDGLRYRHAEHEMEYTPSVTSVKQLLKWNEPRQWDLNQPIAIGNMTYKHFEVERMYEKLPRTLLKHTRRQPTETQASQSHCPYLPSTGANPAAGLHIMDYVDNLRQRLPSVPNKPRPRLYDCTDSFLLD